MEKPEINIREFVMTGFKERDFAALSSSTDIPVINERYEGKRGNTQGDKKENAPAVNATRRLTESCTELSSMKLFEYCPEAKFSYVDRAQR